MREQTDEKSARGTELRLLQAMPVFGGLPEEPLGLLLEHAGRVEIPAGGYYFREGDPGTTMYVLLSGRVEVIRERDGVCEPLGRLGPGDCFGEMALLDLSPRSASVRAVVISTALAIPHTLLYQLYRHAPEPYTMMMMNLARELSRRLRSTDERLARYIGLEAVAWRRDDRPERLTYV